MGIQFIFKDKTIVVPDLPPKFTSIQNSASKYEFDFDYERKILNDYEAAEEQERQKLEENMEAETAAKAEQEGVGESPAPAASQLITIEPEKSVTPSTESTQKPLIKVDRSILEDFEFQALRDDPFVAAELGTINDLEELRDVLASMQTTKPTESRKTNMYKNLKNISFPHLSLDENGPNINANPSSAPSSRLNLFTTLQQPSILTRDSSEHASYSNNIGSDNDKNDRPSSSGNANASPIRFDLESDTTKSETERQLCSIDSDCDSSSSVSLLKVNSYRSTPSFQNVTHIPIPMGNEMQEQNHSPQVSDSHPIESPLEEQCKPDDPPVVQRLVKMGFKRKKALALYKVVSKQENTVSDDNMISQLCCWNELEDKGLEPTVCLAAVISAPNDLEKAFKFGTMVSELCEMGFPMNSVLKAVRASNMNKEDAVTFLLDPSGSPSSATPPQQRSSQNHHSHLLEALATRKGKKKEKKSYMSYLHAKH
ncbi:unnamed protein product [Hymenolepis diminuta]|nr:unnamed protein product [Hymenolepis diminuta]